MNERNIVAVVVVDDDDDDDDAVVIAELAVTQHTCAILCLAVSKSY